MVRWLLAAIHLLAFGIGFGAIWARAHAFSRLPDPAYIPRVLKADAWWGIAAILWLGTGIPRLMLGSEKATAYYLSNHLFWLKLGLFTIVFLLEIGPMVDLILWRNAVRKGQPPRIERAPRWALISRIQTVVVVVMVFVATAMARGYGAR